MRKLQRACQARRLCRLPARWACAPLAVMSNAWQPRRRPCPAAALGLSMSEGDAEHMVALLDGDGDGRLSFQEFQRYVVLLPSESCRPQCLRALWVRG